MSEGEEKKWKCMDEVLAESEYSLFNATDRRNLLDDFPELRECPAIMLLVNRPNDLLWVWNYACRSSPAMQLHSERERVTYAILKVWPNAHEREQFDLINRFMDRDKELEEAVEAMRNFQPGPRYVMLVACEQMINMSKAVMDVDPRTIKSIADWTEKKAAISTMDAALELMHKAQKMSEHGLGIVKQPKGTKKAARVRGAALARAHSSQQIEA